MRKGRETYCVSTYQDPSFHMLLSPNRVTDSGCIYKAEDQLSVFKPRIEAH